MKRQCEWRCTKGQRSKVFAWVIHRLFMVFNLLTFHRIELINVRAKMAWKKIQGATVKSDDFSILYVCIELLRVWIPLHPFSKLINFEYLIKSNHKLKALNTAQLHWFHLCFFFAFILTWKSGWTPTNCF